MYWYKKVKQEVIIIKNNTEITKEEYEIRKNRLKILKIIMIIINILAAIILCYQIYTKEITYSSYIILILCNIITFVSKPDKRP